ncbi:protein RFT1 homolog [Toxorhynchites rutilus septentrionalis]|uniref:protein RFT1 homolog n=1 Tax=Toxorhynchites rutilus septentrionalis TaxID=329112 RepID=UPI0024794DE8|nr:protein RFT1 homolog [Toxorhynchites rutilus septentrionalis]
MGRNILASSLQHASFSIVFQILCRCITFAINAFIVRSVGREVLGITNVRLLLLESTLLFLSKEAITRSALSSRHNKHCTWAQLINQLWITVPACFILAIPCLYIWLNWLSTVDEHYYVQYRFGCFAIAFACVIELTAEAPIFVSQVFCFVKLKVVMDTSHIFIRSLVFIVIVLLNKNITIYAFGVAQIISAVTIIAGNYAFFHMYIPRLMHYRRELKRVDDKYKLREMYGDYYENMDDFPFMSIKEMCPGVLPNPNSAFNPDLQKLVLSFTKQGVLKQVLTEGEKYVMSVSPVLTFSEQATYDVVNNMGSLAARFIFRPIEDSSYFYFTQTIARDATLLNQKRDAVNEACQVLSYLFRVVTSIALVGFVFGQFYAGTILLLYGGADFVEGGLPEILLRWHCLAIVLLAVNGIAEGYMFATNTSQEIDTYNYYMAFCSVAFLMLSYQLTNWLGPVGFILANCCNMSFRISYSLFYIHKHFNEVNTNPLQGFLPRPVFVTVLCVCGIMCKISEAYFSPHSILYHVLFGALCTCLTLLTWCFENRQLLQTGLAKYRERKVSLTGDTN